MCIYKLSIQIYSLYLFGILRPVFAYNPGSVILYPKMVGLSSLMLGYKAVRKNSALTTRSVYTTCPCYASVSGEYDPRAFQSSK